MGNGGVGKAVADVSHLNLTPTFECTDLEGIKYIGRFEDEDGDDHMLLLELMVNIEVEWTVPRVPAAAVEVRNDHRRALKLWKADQAAHIEQLTRTQDYKNLDPRAVDDDEHKAERRQTRREMEAEARENWVQLHKMPSAEEYQYSYLTSQGHSHETAQDMIRKGYFESDHMDVTFSVTGGAWPRHYPTTWVAQRSAAAVQLFADLSNVMLPTDTRFGVAVLNELPADAVQQVFMGSGEYVTLADGDDPNHMFDVFDVARKVMAETVNVLARAVVSLKQSPEVKLARLLQEQYEAPGLDHLALRRAVVRPSDIMVTGEGEDPMDTATARLHGMRVMRNLFQAAMDTIEPETSLWEDMVEKGADALGGAQAVDAISTMLRLYSTHGLHGRAYTKILEKGRELRDAENQPFGWYGWRWMMRNTLGALTVADLPQSTASALQVRLKRGGVWRAVAAAAVEDSMRALPDGHEAMPTLIGVAGIGIVPALAEMQAENEVMKEVAADIHMAVAAAAAATHTLAQAANVSV